MAANTAYDFIHCKLTFSDFNVTLTTVEEWPMSGPTRTLDKRFDDNGNFRTYIRGDLDYSDLNMECSLAEFHNLILVQFDDDNALTNPDNKFTMKAIASHNGETISKTMNDCIIQSYEDTVARNGEARTTFVVRIGSISVD